MGASPRIRPSRLASKLLWARTRLRLTQTDLANQLSDHKVVVSYKDVSKYEKGEREPSLIVLLRYARLVDTPMEVFADDELDMGEGDTK